MQTDAYMIIHYGRDYAPYAIQAIDPLVDRIHVLYTPTPSHGHAANVPCPETREELRAACEGASGKVFWREAPFRAEGAQRDYALSLCRPGGLALVVDCDEVWRPDVLETALQMAWDGSARTWRLRFTTLWRSFRWVCRDEMLPERIHDLRPGRQERWAAIPPELGEIHHFGYAVRDKIMRYKMLCHGHKGEWRPGWYEQKWSPWPPVQDVHPTCVGFWNPKPYDPAALAPNMRDHPFWGLERIE